MSRPKRPVILRKGDWSGGFDSIAAAASFLRVSSPSLQCVLRNRGRHKTIHGYTAEFDDGAKVADRTEYWSRRREFDPSKRVTIDGVTYAPILVENKTSCHECDILKARPPRSDASYPLCFEYAAYNHKIYEMCQGHQIIWKKCNEKT